MDRITKSIMDEYCSDIGYEGSEADKFERLSNFCVIAPKAFESFDIEDVCVGQDSTPGIDGFGLIVNGQVVASPEELADMLDSVALIEARFVFVQAKTSNGFEGKVMLDFGDEVYEFFNRPPEEIPANLLSGRRMADQLFDKSAKLKSNPQCSVAYVTTGSPASDDLLLRKAESARIKLDGLNLFSSVDVEYLGASAIQGIFRAARQKSTAEFEFRDRTTIGTVEGISQAFLGILPAQEFLKIVEDDFGELRPGIFEGNVRDFQGVDNEVNSKMQATLTEEPDRFVVLNNGVTVVARAGSVVGNKFTIEDFQIVNGCQTANVLHQGSSGPQFDSAAVSLRVVITDSDDLANGITAATNSQTPVKNEELYALLGFQKTLEQFFRTFKAPQDLYFERRSKQYQNDRTVPKNRVVTRAQMVKAFASTYLNVPHRATGYYTSLFKSDVSLFGDDHKPEGYYAAAVAQFRLEGMLKSGELPPEVRTARYQLLHAARHLALGGDMPFLNSKQFEKESQKFSAILWSAEASTQLFEQAVSVLRSVAATEEIDRDFTKRQSVTTAIARECAEVRARTDSAIWMA